MATNYIFTPQVEAQLLAWHNMARDREATKEQAGPCITISREFGCQAYPVARALEARLNAGRKNSPWVVVDKQILEEVARISGYTIDQIEKSRDTPPSLKAIFAMFLDPSHAEETAVFAHTRSAIHKFASEGHCILIGRGTVFTTQDLPNCVHLRLVASLPFRVQKIMDVHNLTESEAQDYIALHQKQREDYIHRFAQGRIDDPLLYHLIVNNERHTPDEIADLVKSYLDLRK